MRVNPGAARRACFLAGVAASVLAPTVAAQETSSAERGGADAFGQAIIVTAERRETNLQDTPISIVAVTEETIAAKGIEDLADLGTFTPNLNITPSRGNGSAIPSFSIRGISGGGGATSERGVGLYIDGIYVPRTSGSVLRVLDIDRIEVLRGPQGTLFGRNSTGGAIRIFTRQPELDDFNGYARVTAGNLGRLDVVGAVNVPLSQTAALRVQGARLHEGGFVERGTQKLGGSTDYIARANLRLQPTDRFEATVGFLYSDSKASGTPLVFTEFDMRPGIEGVIQGNFGDWLNDAFKAAGQAPLAPYNDPRIVIDDYTAPSVCLLDDFNPDFDAACEQFDHNRYWQSDLRMSYELTDRLTLSSVSGLAKLDHKASVDYQLLGTEDRKTDVKSTVFYQELQLNAELFDGALDLVSGLNYFHEKSTGPGLTINRRGTSAFPSDANGDGDAGLFRLNDTFTKQISDSYGAFLSGTWHVTERFNVTGGLRFAYDKKDYEQTEHASANFVPAPGTASTFVESDDSWKQVDYRGTIDYHLTDDIMAYATVSKAYKAGQYSHSIIDRIPGPDQSGDFIRTIPPEKVKNYEAGLRITAFDGRLRFNPTAFYMQWTNRQAATQVTCPTSPSCPLGFEIRVINTGDVDLYGGELDMQIALTDNFYIDGAGAIIRYDLADEAANGGPNLYPSVPELAFNVGANYRLDAAVGEFTFNLSYAHTGEQATHPSQVGDSAYTLPAIDLVNARLQFEPADLPLTVTLFANNLLNNTYATFGQRFGGGYWDQGGPPNRLHPLALPPRSALAEVRGRPRHVGLSLQYDF